MTTATSNRSVASIVATPWFRPVVVLVAFVAVGLSASSDDGPVLCPFRRCTGGYCPGCGMTRATGSLVRGDLAGSWHRHPFLLIATLQAAVLAGIWRTAGAGVRAALLRRRDALLIANAVIVATIWLVRLTAGQIPMPFG